MMEPSPFYDPEASGADLDAFLEEVDVALEGFVPAEHEHLVLRREARPSAPGRLAARRPG